MTESIGDSPSLKPRHIQDDELGQELQRFCDQFAHCVPDPELLAAYRCANAKVFAHAAGQEHEEQKIILRKALAAKRDLEALEYAWRLGCHDNILTKKVHIFMYLLETSPDHYNKFVNESKQRTTAYVVLGFQGLRSALKLCKGYISLISLRAGV